MRYFALSIFITALALSANAQKPTIAEIKTEMEKSPNSPLYVRDVLKKRFKIDTIVVSRTAVFRSMADSLAYKGKEKKVYGPFAQQGSRYLVQILAKSPNLFFRISQIFIDTAVFHRRFADSLATSIMAKLKDGSATFEDLAQTYSMGGESVTKGDLGWVARGVLFPQIEKELMKRKKGEVFRLWSPNGLHIIKKTEEPKQDTGFALIMRVFL